jgi:hypothetical protein
VYVFSFALATQNQSSSDEESTFGADDRLEFQYELQDISLFMLLFDLFDDGCKRRVSRARCKVGVRTNAAMLINHRARNLSLHEPSPKPQADLSSLPQPSSHSHPDHSSSLSQSIPFHAAARFSPS